MTRPAALVLLLIALSFQPFVSNVHASEAAGRSDKEEVHNRAKQKILRIKEALEAGEVHALKKDIAHQQAELRALRRDPSRFADVGGQDDTMKHKTTNTCTHDCYSIHERHGSAGIYFPPAAAYAHNPLGLPQPKKVRDSEWHHGWFTTIYKSVNHLFASAKDENSRREHAYRRELARLKTLEVRERRLAQQRSRLAQERGKQHRMYAEKRKRGETGLPKASSRDQAGDGRGRKGKEYIGKDLWRYSDSRQMEEGRSIAQDGQATHDEDFAAALRRQRVRQARYERGLAELRGKGYSDAFLDHHMTRLGASLDSARQRLWDRELLRAQRAGDTGRAGGGSSGADRGRESVSKSSTGTAEAAATAAQAAKAAPGGSKEAEVLRRASWEPDAEKVLQAKILPPEPSITSGASATGPGDTPLAQVVSRAGDASSGNDDGREAGGGGRAGGREKAASAEGLGSAWDALGIAGLHFS